MVSNVLVTNNSFCKTPERLRALQKCGQVSMLVQILLFYPKYINSLFGIFNIFWALIKFLQNTATTLFFFLFFSVQTEPLRCVIFQLDFGIDIGLSLQWSKQIGCWLIQCRRIRADQEEWGWSMHRCLHRPNNVCRDTFKQRPSFSNADVKGGGAARLGHSGYVPEMTFWPSRVQRRPQVNDFCG